MGSCAHSRVRRLVAAFLVVAMPVAVAALEAAPSRAAVRISAGPGSSGAYLALPCLFTGVATISANDAWAVGSTLCLNTERPTLAHWNGSAWTQVTGPFLPSLGFLNAVTPFAGGAWAVGGGNSNLRPNALPFIMRLTDGTWQRVKVPNVGGGYLTGVAASSPKNAWAVGRLGGHGPFILHWNGSAWKRVPLPVRTGGVTSVAVTSARNAWAVGITTTPTPLILHWGGKRWRQVASPKVGHPAALLGITATSAKNAWAVGANSRGALILHWNGMVWKVAKIPALSGEAGFVDVDATSAKNAWAVGGDDSGPLTFHWNGTSWINVTNPGPADGALDGVSIGPSSGAWAVGSMTGSAGSFTLIMRWHDNAWN